jgi:hypothetical protein
VRQAVSVSVPIRHYRRRFRVWKHHIREQDRRIGKILEVPFGPSTKRINGVVVRDVIICMQIIAGVRPGRVATVDAGAVTELVQLLVP